MAKKNKKWHPSEDILSFIKEKEGFIPRSTRPKGDTKWTVGYGFTDEDIVKRYMDKDITKEEADAILSEVVNRRLSTFERSTPNFDKLNNNQRDALFSYFYNIGEGNYRNKSPKLQTALQELNHEKIMEQMDAGYNKEGQSGLRTRRDEERQFYAIPYGIPHRRVEEYEHPLQDPDYTNINVMPDGGKVKGKKIDSETSSYKVEGDDDNGFYLVSDNSSKSRGIADTADPDAYYDSINPGWDTNIITAAIKGPGALWRKAFGQKRDERALDHEEKLWKAYTHGDLQDLPISKYRFEGDDENADYIGLPQDQAVMIQAMFDPNYIEMMKEKSSHKKTGNMYEEADLIRDIYKRDNISKEIFEKPDTWIVVNEGNSPVYIQSKAGDKDIRYTGLGGLKNFSVRWNSKDSTIDVKDNYDFSRNKLVEKFIPERDKPLRIRDKIKFDPKKGSILYRNPGYFNEKGYKPVYKKGGVIDTNKLDFGGTTQSEAQDYVYNKLVDEFNFTPVQAVGIVANLTYESGLNPTIVRKGGKDFGLQQWVGERRKNLYAYAKRKGHEIPTFDDQLEYVVKEYRGDKNSGWTHINKGSNLYKKDPEKFKDFDYYQYSKAEFDNSNSISDAVVAWNQGFGRPPKEYLATDRRIKIGKDLAARYGIEDGGDARYAEGSVGASNALPEIEITQARPAGQTAGVEPIGAAPASFSYGSRPELQSDMDRWMEDYGKDLAAQLLNTNTLLNKTADLLNRNKEQEDLDNEQTSEQIKQASQEQQLRSFISELLPSMQMKYKGVAKSNS